MRAWGERQPGGDLSPAQTLIRSDSQPSRHAISWPDGPRPDPPHPRLRGHAAAWGAVSPAVLPPQEAATPGAVGPRPGRRGVLTPGEPSTTSWHHPRQTVAIRGLPTRKSHERPHTGPKQAPFSRPQPSTEPPWTYPPRRRRHAHSNELCNHKSSLPPASRAARREPHRAGFSRTWTESTTTRRRNW